MLTKFSGEGLFFVSDTHFNHESILKFCNRPFKSIEEHDRTLINNWNSIIGQDDTVFHLGDFCFGNPSKWQEILSQLNGHIYLIKGNHDDKNLNKSLCSLFEDVVYQARILIDNQTVYLNHYPFLCYAHADPKHYDNYVINLCGHIHTGPRCNGSDTDRWNLMKYPTQYDVGVDNNDFKPISWNEVKNKINLQINQCIK